MVWLLHLHGNTAHSKMVLGSSLGFSDQQLKREFTPFGPIEKQCKNKWVTEPWTFSIQALSSTTVNSPCSNFNFFENTRVKFCSSEILGTLKESRLYTDLFPSFPHSDTLLSENSGAHLLFALVCQDPRADIINPVLHIQLSNVPHCFATFLLQQPCLHQLMLTWESSKKLF